MMHTKPALANHCAAVDGGAQHAPDGGGANVALRLRWPARLVRWLMPWPQLRVRAADGGPPQWPLPWR